MTAVSIDPADYAEAAANFNAIQANAIVRLGALSRELRGYDNMAGTDPGGKQFADQYNPAAADIVRGLDYLAVRASELDFGLMCTASEHYLTEQAAAGNTAVATIYPPRPLHTGENPEPPPSAFGGDPNPPTDTLGEIWAAVAGAIGQMFPDANTKTLRNAARTWDRIGEHLDEVANEIQRADDPLTANRSREIFAIQAEVRELEGLVREMAREAGEVSGSCIDYADIVEATLEETFTMIRQLVVEIAVGAGIGFALSFVTFGGAGAAAAAGIALRVAAVAARIGGLIGRVLSVAARSAHRIAQVHLRLTQIIGRLAPRVRGGIRIGNTVVSETAASMLAEGVVRGENANYGSAFVGGLVGSGTTAGVLALFGRRASQIFPNVLAGGTGGFTGALASGGVEGEISVQSLVFGTAFGTAAGPLGAGGGNKGGDVNAPKTGGSAPAAASGGGGTTTPSPSSTAADFPSSFGGGGVPGGTHANPQTGAPTPTSTSTTPGHAADRGAPVPEPASVALPDAGSRSGAGSTTAEGGPTSEVGDGAQNPVDIGTVEPTATVVDAGTPDASTNSEGGPSTEPGTDAVPSTPLDGPTAGPDDARPSSAAEGAPEPLRFSEGDVITEADRLQMGLSGNRYMVAVFDRVASIKYWDGISPSIGAPGKPFFVMSLGDAGLIHNPADAARLTGNSPATLRALTGHFIDTDPGSPTFAQPLHDAIPASHRQNYAVVFEVREGNSPRTPTAEDAGGWPHFTEGGYTAVLQSDGTHAVNSVREWVVTGGDIAGPGDFRVSLTPGTNDWRVEQVY